MEITSEFLSYNGINEEWKKSRMDSDAAKFLTLKQVEEFEKIVKDDEAWGNLLSVFNSGRQVDAWLALDWPDGFDELVLCVPLCKLVNFECSKCTVGKRQENNSCANDFSLFGYIAELLKIPDREGLINHTGSIKKILLLDDFRWNIAEKKISN
ncbi:MAG: hypothetical protein IPL53_22605 [Ignavibacteria bacterium]|nr:hypothetical protein [Ignavibacteria bacterium]